MNIDYSLFPTANPVVVCIFRALYGVILFILVCTYVCSIQLESKGQMYFFHSILVGQIPRLSSLWIYRYRIIQVEWTFAEMFTLPTIFIEALSSY